LMMTKYNVSTVLITKEDDYDDDDSPCEKSIPGVERL
jgi:hypothetical protein